MGLSMAKHLALSGYPLAVYNRTKNKAEELLQRGAAWCDSPREVARRCNIVFTMVGYPCDVEEVILGKDGVLQGIEPEGIIVDMTTSSPELARKIAQEAAKKQVQSLDAPVSGGDSGARNATLSIMMGGDEQTAKALEPFWNILGKTVVYHGPAGSGQHAKMVNQTLIAGNMLGVCEALLYAYQAGLDVEKVLQSVSTGAAGSWSLSNLAPRILKNDFAPGFLIEHFIKDLGLVLEESHRMGIALPGAALVRQLYIAAQSQLEEGGKAGTQSLILTLAAMSGKAGLTQSCS